MRYHRYTPSCVLKQTLRMMIASGAARGVGSFALWLLAGLVYAIAGLAVLYDPALASLTLSLMIGTLLLAAGVTRIWSGLQARPAAGWGWIVAAGIVSFGVGCFVIAAWPGVSLFLLGAVLVVDLIFQGWGSIAFGLALKAH